MNSQLKSYFYFTVIAAAIMAMMGLLQGSADAATDVPHSPVLFSNLSIYDGKNDKLQKNMHLFSTGSKTDQSSEPMAVNQSTSIKRLTVRVWR